MAAFVLSCVSACSTSAATTPSVVVKATAPSSSQPTSTPSEVVIGGGAKAGPDVTSTSHPIYDPSLDAKKRFFLWINYELQTKEDANLVESGSDKTYNAGIVVCGSRNSNVGTDSIEAVITREMGYTRSGSTAIIKSALMAMCPWYDLGYKTYFDRNVDAFMVAVSPPRLTYPNGMYPYYEYGYFMKEVCGVMAADGGTVVYDHMRAETNFALTEAGNVKEQVLFIYIKEAVNAGCLGYFDNLPPVIQMTK